MSVQRFAGMSITDHLPPLHVLRDQRPSCALPDPYGTTMEALAKARLGERFTPGARVAITAGSRGISNLAAIVRGCVEAVRAAGGDPFVIPAMGSHGSGTAEGQVEMLAHLGVTEASIGAPIRSQMAVIEYGRSARVPIYCDKLAKAADAILLVGRIKPHTDFTGGIESGLLKMSAIGLGKAIGAKAYHAAFARYGYEAIIREVAAYHLAHLPIVAGLAVIEDHRGGSAIIEALGPSDIVVGEERLLKAARDYLSTLPFDELDLLIVDEMGKNYSGAGMDTNVTGRAVDGRSQKSATPRVRELFVRSLSTESGGNATGIGLADFCTQRLADAIDWPATYLNALTAAQPAGARLPIVVQNDAEGIGHALAAAGVMDPSAARIGWISNTLHMETIYASDAALAGAVVAGRFTDAGSRDIHFDTAGNLVAM